MINRANAETGVFLQVSFSFEEFQNPRNVYAAKEKKKKKKKLDDRHVSH